MPANTAELLTPTEYAPENIRVVGAAGLMGSELCRILSIHRSSGYDPNLLHNRLISEHPEALFHFVPAEHRQKVLLQMNRAEIAEQIDRRAKEMIILSLPLEVIRATGEKDSPLLELFGVDDLGQESVLLHNTSVQQPPFEILAGKHLQLGIHQMHRSLLPNGEDPAEFNRQWEQYMRDQTVIITETPKSKNHPQYEATKEWLRERLINDFCYGQVEELPADIHDQIMSNIQFINTCVIFVINDILFEAYRQNISLDQALIRKLEPLTATLERTLRQEPHVFHGIATGNLYNEMQWQVWENYFRETTRPPDTFEGQILAVLDSIGGMRKRFMDEMRLDQRQRAVLSTPNSRQLDQTITNVTGTEIKNSHRCCIPQDFIQVSRLRLHSALEDLETFQRYFSEQSRRFKASH